MIATRRLPDLAPGFRSTDADHAAVRDLAEGLFRTAGARGVIVSDERTELGNALAQRLTPDVALSPPSTDFGFVHRRTAGADVYFLANTGNRPLRADARFRQQGMTAEWWNPVSGAIAPAQVRPARPSMTTIALDIEPYGSRVIVFSRQAAAPPAPTRSTSAPVPRRSTSVAAGTSRFGPQGPAVTMDTLRSWTDDDATRYFSGVATYEKSVIVPGPWSRTGSPFSSTLVRDDRFRRND